MLYVTAHPSATRKRREKGRGKEPEVLRGETHPAAPWSRSAAGLPRGITLWRVPAPDGWAPWAALLALVLIKQIKQRHSSPGPRGSAAPLREIPGGSGGCRSCCSRSRAASKMASMEPKRSGRLTVGSGRCCRSLAAGMVSRALCHTEGTVPRTRVPWQPPAEGPALAASSTSLRAPIPTHETHPKVTPAPGRAARERRESRGADRERQVMVFGRGDGSGELR